jgi:hypothetical protein
MADKRLRDLLIQAELEDCRILEEEASAFLEAWGVSGDPATDEPTSAAPPSASP